MHGAMAEQTGGRLPGNGLGGPLRVSGGIPAGFGLEASSASPTARVPSVLEALGDVDKASDALLDVCADLANRMGFPELADRVRGLPAPGRDQDTDGCVRLGLLDVKHELERCIAVLATIRTAL